MIKRRHGTLVKSQNAYTYLVETLSARVLLQTTGEQQHQQQQFAGDKYLLMVLHKCFRDKDTKQQIEATVAAATAAAATTAAVNTTRVYVTLCVCTRPTVASCAATPAEGCRIRQYFEN